MALLSGTPETRTEHEPNQAAVGVVVSLAIPVAIAIAGIARFGWDGIAWLGAIVWGIVAAFAFWLVLVAGKSMGMTRMDLTDLLGSMFTRPHTDTSHRIGFAVHHINGALLAIAGAYGVLLVNWTLNWASGLVWGVVLWALGLLLFTSIGGVHPAIRHGQEEDPGTAATNFGSMTPAGSLIAHLVYGLVLGLLYQNWPLA